MRLQLVRHATLVMRYPSTCLLIDPQLDDAGQRAPLPAATGSPARNPTRSMPVRATELVDEADAVLLTHLHADHFDRTARRLLDPHVPILCQPQDVGALRDWGFRDVRPVHDEAALGALDIHRTPGRHGHGVLADAMGPVSGFVLRHPGEPTLYVAGDTVWYHAVRDTLARARPDVVVLNGGAARLVEGPPVTMTAEEVLQAARAADDATVVIVHFEASNACTETRDQLRRRIAAEPDLRRRVKLPADAEELELRSGA